MSSPVSTCLPATSSRESMAPSATTGASLPIEPSPNKINHQKPEALIKTTNQTQCNRTQSNDTAVQRLCGRLRAITLFSAVNGANKGVQDTMAPQPARKNKIISRPSSMDQRAPRWHGATCCPVFEKGDFRRVPLAARPPVPDATNTMTPQPTNKYRQIPANFTFSGEI